MSQCSTSCLRQRSESYIIQSFKLTLKRNLLHMRIIFKVKFRSCAYLQSHSCKINLIDLHNLPRPCIIYLHLNNKDEYECFPYDLINKEQFVSVGYLTRIKTQVFHRNPTLSNIKCHTVVISHVHDYTTLTVAYFSNAAIFTSFFCILVYQYPSLNCRSSVPVSSLYKITCSRFVIVRVCENIQLYIYLCNM